MSTHRDDTVLPELGVLHLQDGDVLVLACQQRVTQAEAEQLQHRVRERLSRPDLQVLVLDGGVSLAVLRQPAISVVDPPDPLRARVQ